MVEDECFRQMIHVFNPGYTLPSRTNFTKLMERKYEQTFRAVKSDIKATQSKIALGGLDPRFRILRFLTPEQVFKVQAKVQTQAFKVRKDHQQQQRDGVHEKTSLTSTIIEVAPAPTTPVSLLHSLLDSEEECDGKSTCYVLP